MLLLGEPFSAVDSVTGRLSLASKRCVYDTRLKLEWCYAIYLHKKGVGLLPVLTSLAMNTRHNNPNVSHRTCPLAGYTWHNNPIVSQRTCHWEDHPSSSSMFVDKYIMFSFCMVFNY